MNDINFTIMNYKSRINALEKKVEAYRSSLKFEELRNFHTQCLKEKEVEINHLKKQIEQDSIFHKKTNREWREACDEVYKDCVEQLSQKDKEMEKKDSQLSKAYQELNALYEVETAQKIQIALLQEQLTKECEKNAKLVAQNNKNYENSGKPSSSNAFHGKIKNSREKTENKQGGQKGHQGYERKKYEPTNKIIINAPEEYLDTTKYKATGKIIKKQVVNISLMIQVDEYQTQEFRCLVNRHKVHAPFPEGVINEVNFGASVHALAFLLNNHYNVSIAKTKDFLCEATEGVFNISTGCINQLVKKFAKKTKKQQEAIFDQLVKAPVLYTDFTPVRLNGKLAQVLICATEDEMMFYAREKKGHKGIEGSPVEYTTNTMMHDHEKAFYSYGGGHQECLVHVLRYLKASIENEGHLSWNKRMYETIKKMIHYIKSGKRDEKEIQQLMKEYDNHLELAELNYKAHPPTQYHRDGYNLAKRLKAYRNNHLLFLMVDGIPYDNNTSERYARVIKRKLHQMTTFRSYKTLEDTCASFGMVESFRLQGGNLLEKVTNVFDIKNG